MITLFHPILQMAKVVVFGLYYQTEGTYHVIASVSLPTIRPRELMMAIVCNVRTEAADDAQTITSPHLKDGSEANLGLYNVFIVIVILYTKANFFIALQPPWQATLPPTSFSRCA